MNWIEVNGTSLRYELSGSGKTTLVLVHEMGGTLDSWDQVLPALNNSRCVLRYDTRGAGLSEKIHGKVTFDDMADDLAALLDATGIAGKVALAGTAVGGAIAIHFAVRHAARAGVLVVTRPGIGGMHPAALLSFASALCYAFYSITTRMLARTDSNETILFYSNLVGVLAMFPVLVFMYVRLARIEECESLREFGAAYRAYMARVPAFIPRFGSRGDRARA